MYAPKARDPRQDDPRLLLATAWPGCAPITYAILALDIVHRTPEGGKGSSRGQRQNNIRATEARLARAHKQKTGAHKPRR
jgi:hypothetical protein